MDARLQGRYLLLVKQHMDVATNLAAGIHSLPQVGASFAATQGAWRFFANPRGTLPALVEPLRELGRQGSARGAAPYALLVHDWSKIDYAGHTRKTDQVQLSNALDFGYELTTALLVDADDGQPPAPLELSLLAAAGRQSTAAEEPLPPVAHLDQVLPTMQAARRWDLPKRPVHVVDREADSLYHLRQWQADGHLFLVRADDRRVTHREASRRLSEVVQTLSQGGAFQDAGAVAVRGKRGRSFVAETGVVLSGPAWRRDPDGKTYRVAGPPLALRLVVVQVRDGGGRLLAEWLLLTNVPADVSAAMIGSWYYWRWGIESFHKRIKSAGMHLESWRQGGAGAIAKRLLVACMACVVVWQLEGQETPQARSMKRFLVGLSGRQTKRSRPVTAPALLAALRALLLMLDVLEKLTPEEIREQAEAVLPILVLSGWQSCVDTNGRETAPRRPTAGLQGSGGVGRPAPNG